MKTITGLFVLLMLLAIPPSAYSVNRVLVLDGTNDGVRVAAPSSALDLGPTNSMTSWVRFTRAPSKARSTIAIKYGAASDQVAYIFYYDKASMCFWVDYGDGRRYSTEQINWSNGWHHIAFTMDGTVGRWYINGTLSTVGTNRTFFRPGSNKFYIGRSDINGDNEFPGYIDDLSLWNVALSSESIQSIMTNGMSGTEDGLRGCWNFDDGTANDLTTNMNNGVFVDNATTCVFQANYPLLTNAISFTSSGRVWSVQIMSTNIFRIQGVLEGATNIHSSLMIIQTNTVTGQLTVTDNGLNVFTESYSVLIETNNAHITFETCSNQYLLSAGDSLLTNTYLCDGSIAYSIQQNFQISSNDALYGLGQSGSGQFNLKGHTIQLFQENTRDVTPFLISSGGYAILWDNYSKSTFSSGTTNMAFASDVADAIEYYVIFGPDFDSIIRGYRELTGDAPLYPKWAFGYIQSWNWYTNADNLIDIVEEYRNRNLPLDCIVQDAGYWGRDPDDRTMGFTMSSNLFPDPAGMISLLHTNYNCQFMISIWPYAGTSTTMYAEMKTSQQLFRLYPGLEAIHLYDPFNPQARTNHWRWLNQCLFTNGVDAWWMDASEPELNPSEVANGITALGPFVRHRNAFSLMSAKGIYEGQRAASDQKRVFSLSRSVFAGQQRYGAATWTGDVDGTWDTLRKQITEGLNFCLSGLPYWTTDIGGYKVNYPGGNTNKEYWNLYVRWFQFGTFCPLFRSHGEGTPREIWRFGEPGSPHYDALEKFSHLRSRLIPYIYSTAWEVTSKGYTMYRALPFDFASDREVFHIGNQFMFGPSIMVCPLYGTTNTLYRQFQPSELYATNGNQGGLSAEYFNGRNLGNYATSRVDSNIDFNWGTNPPVDNVNTDFFSVRWTGYFLATNSGTYEFQTKSDDGVRLWVDDKLVISNWTPHPETTDTGTVNLVAGNPYKIQLEIFEATGNAQIILACRVGETSEFHVVQSSELASSNSVPGGLSAEYFDGQDLGNSVTSRVDSNIDFNWGGNPPADNVNADFFSVRWTGSFDITNEGIHEFRALVDDGVRLWVDQQQVIDDWNWHGDTYDYGSLFLDEGKHNIRLEMNEGIGLAQMKLTYRLVQDEFDTDITARTLYLPKDHTWYDFWTGESCQGGMNISTSPPIDKIPLYVKGGSIIPFGPIRQYVAEKPDAFIELRVYPGADASFVLYEDENDSYNYETGRYSEISMHWDDASRKFSIDASQGEFFGMQPTHDFRVVVVTNGLGVGIDEARANYYPVHYTGAFCEFIMPNADTNDSDGDGLSNHDEAYIYGTLLDNPDTDDDGMLDGQEVIAGSQPTNSSSIFGFADAQPLPDDNRVVISWDSVSNRIYRLERTTNLLLGFEPYVNDIPADPPMNTYTDDTPNAVGVYKVRVRMK